MYCIGACSFIWTKTVIQVELFIFFPHFYSILILELSLIIIIISSDVVHVCPACKIVIELLGILAPFLTFHLCHALFIFSHLIKTFIFLLYFLSYRPFMLRIQILIYPVCSWLSHTCPITTHRLIFAFHILLDNASSRPITIVPVGSFPVSLNSLSSAYCSPKSTFIESFRDLSLGHFIWGWINHT